METEREEGVGDEGGEDAEVLDMYGPEDVVEESSSEGDDHVDVGDPGPG